MKHNKYHNIKVKGYDSKKEYARAQLLELLEKNGTISELKKQITFDLCPAQYLTGFNGKKICARRAMRYIADFTYYDEKGKYIVEDCKGFRTQIYKQKKNLMFKLYNINIKES